MNFKLAAYLPAKYTGEFIGVEPREARPFRTVAGVAFVIVGGQFDGQVVTRFTGDSATVRNACGRITRAITGQPLVPGTEIDLGEYARAALCRDRSRCPQRQWNAG